MGYKWNLDGLSGRLLREKVGRHFSCFLTWDVKMMARTPVAILGGLGWNLCAKDSDAES